MLKRSNSYKTIIIKNQEKLEHVYVMEQHIGRSLYAWESVHHINEIKTDNHIDNLFLCSREEHDKAHGMRTVSMYKLYPNWIGKTCSKCHKKFYGSPNSIKNRKRCSVSCKPIKVDKTCYSCGNIYTVPIQQVQNWEYCSRLCKRKANNDASKHRP
jgi:hypothetical protein